MSLPPSIELLGPKHSRSGRKSAARGGNKSPMPTANRLHPTEPNRQVDGAIRTIQRPQQIHIVHIRITRTADFDRPVARRHGTDGWASTFSGSGLADFLRSLLYSYSQSPARPFA